MSTKTVWEFIKKHHAIIVISFISLLITTMVIHFTKDAKEETTTVVSPIDTTLYHMVIKDLNHKITILDDSISHLNSLKSKIQVKYEKEYIDYLDPNAVSDDSITGYIASRIQQKRHNLYLLQQGRK